MIWVDIAILVIVIASVAISLFRGFIREVLSLVAWVAAFVVAFYFSEPVAQHMEAVIHSPTLRILLAYLALFFGTLLIFAIINFFVNKYSKATSLSSTDRLAGAVFGLIRGAAVVLLLVLLAGLTTLPQEAWWDQSMFLDSFENAAMFVRDFLPSAIASHIHF